MTFHMPDSYYEPPEDYSCERCEDSPDIDHDDCIEAAAEAYEDAMIERGEARREEEASYTPNNVA